MKHGVFFIMNHGERDELICQLKLISLRERGNGKILGKRIESVGFTEEFEPLSDVINILKLTEYPDEQLLQLAQKSNISKAKGSFKADTYINKIPFSLKSTRKANPALVNHTRRDGFEYAAEKVGFDIKILDRIVDEYWVLRKAGKIGEDINNSESNSPFAQHKNELITILNYFLFTGTGSTVSPHPAQYILSFDNPLDVKTWKIYNKQNALNLFWDDLIFSLRAKKGMPQGYPNNLSKSMSVKKESIARWTEFIDGDYRGALHIRVK